jgi:glucose/arabinose dehydrogenase
VRPRALLLAVALFSGETGQHPAIAAAPDVSRAPAGARNAAEPPVAPVPAPGRGARIEGRIRAGFVETVIADSIDSPVSMAIARDGRVFVCEQGGRLRVIRRDSLLARPFLTVAAAVGAEEGLLGVAFDPRFDRNRWVYVCYTAAEPARHNRIARYTAAGDTALAGSARTIFELDDHTDPVHVGGALRFGSDGKLYAGTGENGIGERSQSLRSTHGKILRLNPDGSIPTDNPFYATASGSRRAIWARGLRNAFALDVQPETGRIFINDVGGDAFEEVNEGQAGANYGWPMVEGPGEHPRLRAPIHSYGRDRGCAITGGTFYGRPEKGRAGFPEEWRGRYFFAEYCLNEIRWLDPVAPSTHGAFGPTLVPGPVDLRTGPDGCLYYLARGNSDPVGGDHTSRGIVVRVCPAGAPDPRGKGGAGAP